MTMYFPVLRMVPERAARSTLYFKPAGTPRTDAVVAPPSAGIGTLHSRRARHVAVNTVAEPIDLASGDVIVESISIPDRTTSVCCRSDWVVSVAGAEGDRETVDVSLPEADVPGGVLVGPGEMATVVDGLGALDGVLVVVAMVVAVGEAIDREIDVSE